MATTGTNFELQVDLLIIHAVLTPTAVLFWHSTGILLNQWVGHNAIKLVVGFFSAAAVHYLHDVFRNNAPTSSPYLRSAYEWGYDYTVLMICVCYHLGCRAIYELLINYGFLLPIHVAILFAYILVRLSGFRKVMWLPMVVSNDNSVDRYRPFSTVTFHSGTQIHVNIFFEIVTSTCAFHVASLP